MDVALAVAVFVGIGLLGRFMRYGINQDIKEDKDED